MPRQTYAAEQFTEQVQALRKSAKIEVAGEPDGLDVYRQIKVTDKPTAKWLAPIVDALDDDRIVAADNKGDVLTITFHAESVVADQRTPFEIAEVAEVLNEE